MQRLDVAEWLHNSTLVVTIESQDIVAIVSICTIIVPIDGAGLDVVLCPASRIVLILERLRIGNLGIIAGDEDSLAVPDTGMLLIADSLNKDEIVAVSRQVGQHNTVGLRRDIHCISSALQNIADIPRCFLATSGPSDGGLAVEVGAIRDIGNEGTIIDRFNGNIVQIYVRTLAVELEGRTDTYTSIVAERHHDRILIVVVHREDKRVDGDKCLAFHHTHLVRNRLVVVIGHSDVVAHLKAFHTTERWQNHQRCVIEIPIVEI